MSSAVVSTSAALGRPFLFDAEPKADVFCHPEPGGKYAKRISRTVEGSQPYPDPKLANIIPASRLEIRPAPEMVTSGSVALDSLAGGLPRGCLTEICGPASSGRTSVMLAALASATRRGEYCALIDASDAFDPHSAAAAGIDLDRLLWVRCGDGIPESPHSASCSVAVPAAAGDSARPSRSPRNTAQAAFDFDRRSVKKNISRNSEHRLEQVLRAADLLLESGGFGLIVLDLADVPPQAARYIPLTTWFRFRRAVEHKPTILLAIEQQPIAGSCSSLLLRLEVPSTQYSVFSSDRTSADTADTEFARQNQPPSHTQLLTGLEINIELIRSRLERKPARSVIFETKTAWAG